MRHEQTDLAAELPAVTLAPSDRSELLLQVQALVDDALLEFTSSRLGAGASPGEEWLEIREYDRIRLYRERQSVTASTSSRGDRQPPLPHVLAVGTTLGSLDDVMYGALAVTDEELRMRTRYTGDATTVRSKVLHSLVRPSSEDPLRHVNVGWSCFHVSPTSGIRRLWNPRDCVAIESVGTTISSSGDRLGYVLQRSVDLKALSPYEHVDIVRANVATFAVYRELSTGVVLCVAKSFYDLGGVWKAVGVRCIADRVLSLCRLSQCAYMKKLARLMHTALWTHLDDEPPQATGACVVCRASLRASVFSSRVRRCGICRYEVCSRCAHAKKLLTSPATAGGDLASRTPQEQRVRVCAGCIQHARQASALCIALEEQQLDDDGFPTAPRVELASLTSHETQLSADDTAAYHF
ncbi:hypothetical protein P43SY_001349 [Pythium insidiosum]|uniref:FYVE-type domain-containing protein n=1 Tax=Pythium insidiosum TaxID=114742 RepID=A0AAD5LPQ4_PYTIN|nr:hypothetical protein P43SY_001349 [Pythium insidiosum]